jgi:HlyD family secretion protein
MDRKLKKKKWTAKKIGTIALIVVFISFVGYQLLFADKRSKLNVDSRKITISEVTRGPFQEWIPETGTVVPKNTFYLDAIEGGIIQEIILESGAMVEKGDVILRLSNSNLQLDVLNREAQLYEQINLLRNTRLSIQQNSLNLETQLADIDYQLSLLAPQYERFKVMRDENLISDREFEEVEENFVFQKKRKRLTYKQYRQDSVAAIRQLRELSASETRMIRSLEAVGMILDNLVIRAPLNGQLSTPQLQIGQSINSGERLGQVDVVGEYKVRVGIDELYLPKIDTGLIATYPYSGQSYRLKITKIYPTITNGVFEVDMDFIDDVVPDGIRRGQSTRIRIALGNLSEATLLPAGGFYQDTGGNWVFVLDGDDRAVKRNIKLGRWNTENYEVIEGLQPGDRVITSSYDNFGDNQVLLLNENN